jgi:hypothetical protein
MDDMKQFALAAYHSGILGTKEQTATAVARAVMAMQYGAEVGMGPMQAIQGVNIIGGKPSMGAGLIASLVKASSRYNYRVTKHTENECEIEFTEGGKPCGASEFTLKEAEKAGLIKRNPTWNVYPKAMLFARALTQGARWYCADVFAGAVYTPEELGEVTAEVVVETPPEPAPEPEEPKKTRGRKKKNDKPKRLMEAIDVPVETVAQPDPTTDEPPPVEDEYI